MDANVRFLDIFQTVLGLRRQRKFMVKQLQQYQFLYSAVEVYIKDFSQSQKPSKMQIRFSKDSKSSSTASHPVWIFAPKFWIPVIIQGVSTSFAYLTKKVTNSWKFVYILANQCRSPFNLTIFLTILWQKISIQNLLGHPEQFGFSRQK